MQSAEKPHSAEERMGKTMSLPAVGAARPSRVLPSYQRKAPSMSIVSSPKLPSERRFGFTFAAALAFLGVYGIIRHRNWLACSVCLVVSIICGLLAYASPKSLAPLNKAWFHLGEGLGKIVSPIVLGIIFFGLLTPISILTRLFGRDELRLKRRAVNSYWVDRTPPGPTAQSFRNQF